jgi:thiol-disulfide isomerase/thioredoxin
MSMKIGLLIASLAALTAVGTQGQTTYAVGDIVEDFMLEDRNTGEMRNLSEFAGNIILVEWFAYWCPFCQSAADQVDAGIIERYNESAGTQNGNAVIRLGVNMQADNTARDLAGTDAFIAAHGISPVLQDTRRELVARFSDRLNTQPVFAVINGIANTSSHQQWELMLVVNNYATFSSPVDAFVDVIEAVSTPVMPTQIRLHSLNRVGMNMLRFQAAGNFRETIRLQRSSDLREWFDIETTVPAMETDFVEVTVPGDGLPFFLRGMR